MGSVKPTYKFLTKKKPKKIMFKTLLDWHKYKESLPKIQADLSKITKKEAYKICLTLGIPDIADAKKLDRGVVISKLFAIKQGDILYYKLHNKCFASTSSN